MPTSARSDVGIAPYGGSGIPAVAAQTVEGELAAVDAAAGAFFTECQGDFDLVQVHDGVTAIADEVDMRSCVAVISFLPVYRSYADNTAVFNKHFYVAVNSCEAQLREQRLDF